MKRSPSLALALAVLLVLVSVTPAAAVVRKYAGHQTTGNWWGVDGYLRQSGTVPTANAHALWINICDSSGCSQWVQTGTFQGVFPGGNSQTQVHVFYENVDPCGAYYADDLGAPPQANYPYYINYDRLGQKSFTCSNGVPFLGYVFEYRMGGWPGPSPFFYGVLSHYNGGVQVKTETHDNAPVNADYAGCQAVGVCNNQSFGLHLYTLAGTWPLWTTVNSFPTNGDPPWRQTYNQWWSFRACGTPC